MRAGALTGLLLTAALAGCAPGWVPVSAAPDSARPVEVGPLPDPAPFPPRPPGGQLPERHPQGTEVYLRYQVTGVDPSGRVLRLVSYGEPDPVRPGCGSVPVAVRVEETPATVTVGLLGPRPAPVQVCAASLVVAVVDVPLRLPAGHRLLYRWTG